MELSVTRGNAVIQLTNWPNLNCMRTMYLQKLITSILRSSLSIPMSHHPNQHQVKRSTAIPKARFMIVLIPNHILWKWVNSTWWQWIWHTTTGVDGHSSRQGCKFHYFLHQQQSKDKNEFQHLVRVCNGRGRSSGNIVVCGHEHLWISSQLSTALSRSMSSNVRLLFLCPVNWVGMEILHPTDKWCYISKQLC